MTKSFTTCVKLFALLFIFGLSNAAVAAEAAEAAMADASPLGKNGYKIQMFKGIIEEELLAISGA